MGSSPGNPNAPGANTFAELIDILTEGKIGGPANSGSWLKSTYFNDIPIQNPDDSFNYDGVTIDGRLGTADQEYLSGFDSVDTNVSVNVPVTVSGGDIVRTISDTDVDSVRVVLSIPALMRQSDSGGTWNTTLKVAVHVTPENGAGIKQLVVDPDVEGTIFGKYTSEYRKQYILEDIAQYGAAPWLVTVSRVTDDSVSLNLINGFSWHSYTTIIDTKLRYSGRSVVGITLNSEEFGNQIPTRIYKINGREIKIPSNYDPVLRTYTGDWDGTFITAVSSNPAWIVYDLLTEPLACLGNVIAEDMVDKWSLYSCGVYCDGTITSTTRTRQDDGTYVDVESTEPRFSFNGVLDTRGQGLVTVAAVCSAMRAKPIWTGGQIVFVQDKPITTPARPVSPSNVIDGNFVYEGVAKRFRHSVAKVSWNNPEIFGRLDTLELVDDDAVITFGYNSFDFAALGCTSRTEAIRRGNYVLDTDINARESVSFGGGLEWADALPGELLSVQDPNYAATTYEGRVVSGTTTSLVLDKELILESGVTYTMLIQVATAGAEERELTNAAATTDTLTWTTPLSAVPFVGAVLVLSASNLATRLFVIVSVPESDGTYGVSGIEYDAGKFARIDSGTIAEIPVNTSLLPSVLTPPTSISAEAFSYTSGAQALRLFGINLSWTLSVDPRVSQYDIMYRDDTSGVWQPLETTSSRTNSFTWRDVPSGVYDFRVRGVGIGIFSIWVTYTNFTLNAVLSNLAPPTGLDTVDGSGVWSGRDCTVRWTPSVGSEFPSNYVDSVGATDVKYYIIEVRKADTTLLRAFDTAKDATEYTYLYGWNTEDNSGVPIRSLLFYAYAVDVFGNISSTYATLSASNPAPDMSGMTPTLVDRYGYLQAVWTVSTDNDISHYNIYLEAANPPTVLIKSVNHPEFNYDCSGLEVDTSYRVQIEPVDGFGVGTKSVVSGAGTILQIPSINVDLELSGSIIITDSDGNTAATLEALYDGDLSTAGVSYPLLTEEKWVQMEYGIADYMDSIAIWTADANARVYVSYSEDAVTWKFLSAKGTHVFDTNGMMISRVDAPTAAANYWQLAVGKNVGLFHNNIVAKYVKLNILGTSNTTVIYEIIPSRILIAEMAAIRFLSAISANLGEITAGLARSEDYIAAVSGMLISFDDNIIEMNAGGETVFRVNPAMTPAVMMKGQLEIISGSTIGGVDTDTFVGAGYNSNQFPNADMSNGVNDWAFSWQIATADEYTVELNYLGVLWHPAGKNVVGVGRNTPTAGSVIDIQLDKKFAVMEGERYEVQAKLASHRSPSQILILFYDVDGVYILAAGAAATTPTTTHGGQDFSETYWASHKMFFTVPVGHDVKQISFGLRNGAQDGDPFPSTILWGTDFFFAKASANQTEFTLWNGGASIGDVTQTALDIGLETLTGGIKNIDSSTGFVSHLTAANLIFYYLEGAILRAYKSVNRIEPSPEPIANGETKVIPGTFRTPPQVMLWNNNLQTYSPALGSGIGQSLSMDYVLNSLGSNQYSLTATALLSTVVALQSHSFSNMTAFDNLTIAPLYAESSGSADAQPVAIGTVNVSLSGQVAVNLLSNGTNQYHRVQVSIWFVCNSVFHLVYNQYSPEHFGGQVDEDFIMDSLSATVATTGTGARTGYFYFRADAQYKTTFQSAWQSGSATYQTQAYVYLTSLLMNYTPITVTAIPAGTMNWLAIGE